MMSLKQMMRIALISLLFIACMNVMHVKAESLYTVKQGDTLWEIAQNHGISVADLFNWNGLSTSLIFPDQQLLVQAEKEVYVVEKGDTLFKIASTFNITVDQLMDWNKVTSHLIYPGDELYVSKIDGVHQQGALLTNGWTKSSEAPTTIAKTVEKSGQQSTPLTQAADSQKKSTPATLHQTPVLASGKEMTVTATAYTAYCKGCSGTTYTGINLRANPNQKVIAVDPKVIPLGSRVWVEGYGEAIAGDIGGAIKGNMIDVFLEHRQDALNWGRKTVKIKVLE